MDFSLFFHHHIHDICHLIAIAVFLHIFFRILFPDFSSEYILHKDTLIYSKGEITKFNLTLQNNNPTLKGRGFNPKKNKMNSPQEENYRQALRIAGMIFGVAGVYLIIRSVMPVNQPFEQRTEDTTYEEERHQQKLLNVAKK